MIKSFLLNLPRDQKRLLQIFADVILIWLSLYLAFAVRLGFTAANHAAASNQWLFIAAPLITIPIMIRWGMYRAVIRYLGNVALITILKTVSYASLLLTLVIYWYQGTYPTAIPRSFVIYYWLFCLIGIGGLRLFMRHYFLGDWFDVRQSLIPFAKDTKALPKVAIYGAGAAGNQLLQAIRISKDLYPVAFIDDDESLYKRNIAGLGVYKLSDIDDLVKKTGLSQILLAIPSASRSRRKQILNELEQHSLHVRTIPGFMDLVQGRIQVNDIQEVDIADLLGRDTVEPDMQLFELCIKNKVVMVTGAGGSIGSELCRQILGNGVKTLILYEHSEFNLYKIHKELSNTIKYDGLRVEIVPILASIRNFSRLSKVMATWGVNTVYHAAAYKHVPLVELNIAEGIINNIAGTLYTAKAAIASGVENFVLISTDKAVRPTNIMGSTKRIAEMVLQALSKEPNQKTRFTMVRFGNVLNSSGSVIPLFREQIKNGGPVTVTHPNITRYFMTIQEAAQLVIQAGSMGHGGDVFVLDMGDPVRIVDLAEKMIKLSGFSILSEDSPEGDIEIKFIGLRPGEKIYEELLIGDKVDETCHPKIMRADEIMLPWDELQTIIDELVSLSKTGNYLEIRKILRQVVNGYTPQGDIVDLVFSHKPN